MHSIWQKHFDTRRQRLRKHPQKSISASASSALDVLSNLESGQRNAVVAYVLATMVNRGSSQEKLYASMLLKTMLETDGCLKDELMQLAG